MYGVINLFLILLNLSTNIVCTSQFFFSRNCSFLNDLFSFFIQKNNKRGSGYNRFWNVGTEAFIRRVLRFSFWYDEIHRYEECVTVKKRRRNRCYRLKTAIIRRIILTFLAELDILGYF